MDIFSRIIYQLLWLMGLVLGNNGAAVRCAKAILWITGPGAPLVLGILVPVMVFGKSNAGDSQFVGAFIAFIIGVCPP